MPSFKSIGQIKKHAIVKDVLEHGQPLIVEKKCLRFFAQMFDAHVHYVTPSHELLKFTNR